MADGNFFSSIIGFNSTYAAESTRTQYKDETDYDDVDFCKGYDGNDESIFNFESDNEFDGFEA